MDTPLLLVWQLRILFSYMINLIPLTAKKKIITEYWVRVISVWMLISGVVLLVVSLLFLPVYVLVTSQVSVYESSAKEAMAKVAEYDFSASALAEANVQAQKLIELRQMKPFSDLIYDFTSLQGNDIAINNFDFKRTGMKLNSVQLTGKAKDRKALADFRDAMMTLPEVKDVYLPIANLAKDKDINFSISVTLNDVEKKP